jgi:hypothetical protein
VNYLVEMQLSGRVTELKKGFILRIAPAQMAVNQLLPYMHGRLRDVKRGKSSKETFRGGSIEANGPRNGLKGKAEDAKAVT